MRLNDSITTKRKNENENERWIVTATSQSGRISDRIPGRIGGIIQLKNFSNSLAYPANNWPDTWPDSMNSARAEIFFFHVQISRASETQPRQINAR